MSPDNANSRGEAADNTTSRSGNEEQGSDVQSLGEIWFKLIDRAGQEHRGGFQSSHNNKRSNQSNNDGSGGFKEGDDDDDDEDDLLDEQGNDANMSSLSSDSTTNSDTEDAPPNNHNTNTRKERTVNKNNTKTIVRFASDNTKEEDNKARSDTSTASAGNVGGRRKRRKLSEKKRVERNTREQERSNRISDQFTRLRDLLVAAGIVVPKGTKGSVLSLVMEYIKILQDTSARIEMECQQLQDQINRISGGSNGPQAARAIQAAASHNGVASTTPLIMPTLATSQPPSAVDQEDLFGPAADMSNYHYRAAFDHCMFPMAIATLGGSFLDCNEVFCRMTHTASIEQLRAKSIFNFTAKNNLPYAFDRLSNLLTEDLSKPVAPIDLVAAVPNCGLRIHLLQNGGTTINTDDKPTNILLVTLFAQQAPSSPGAISAQVLMAPPLPQLVEGNDEDQLQIKANAFAMEGQAFYAFG